LPKTPTARPCSPVQRRMAYASAPPPCRTEVARLAESAGFRLRQYEDCDWNKASGGEEHPGKALASTLR
jgi:hypothetical protein